MVKYEPQMHNCFAVSLFRYFCGIGLHRGRFDFHFSILASVYDFSQGYDFNAFEIYYYAY